MKIGFILRGSPWPGRLTVGQFMYFVYILRSLTDKRYYVGMTKDVEKRLLYHNRGAVRSTKNRRPFEIVYTEQFENRAEARERETYLKSYRGSREKLTILGTI